MEFDGNVSVYNDAHLNEQRRNVIRAALTLCNRRASEEDVDGILEELTGRYGTGVQADQSIVSALNDEYFASYFKRKLNEENRAQFQDELAARVWETVKQMTWFTDAQKEIPEDLVARVDQKRIDEENHLNDLRAGLFR